MSIDVTPDGTGAEYVIGFEGEYSVAELRRFLEQFESNVDIKRVSITIAPEERLSLRLPVSEEATDIDGSPAPIETSARVQIDSIPFLILTVLEESDRPLRTEEVYEQMTDDTDLTQNAIASRLWNLYQRGLVNKEPYPEDNRQKVYTVTGRGVYALEEARDRSD